MKASRHGGKEGAAGVPRARRFHLLPRRRAGRVVAYLLLAIGYVALMWFWVFPWVDRTFVNRPAL